MRANQGTLNILSKLCTRLKERDRIDGRLYGRVSSLHLDVGEYLSGAWRCTPERFQEALAEDLSVAKYLAREIGMLDVAAILEGLQ